MKLLLDECVSPNLSRRLWMELVDNFSLRDRGLCGLADQSVFNLAQEDGRAIVTINEGDFERLAAAAETHAGIVVIPPGGSRDMQFRFVMHAVGYARSLHAVLPNFTDSICYVAENGNVTMKIVRLASAEVLATVAVPPKEPA